MAIGGAFISDMYDSGQREVPMALYSVGTMMGPTLGPVFGGLITGTLGWRWVFRIAAILVRTFAQACVQTNGKKQAKRLNEPYCRLESP